MNNACDRPVAFGLLLLLGASALAGPPVLCAGADGHIVVEPAFGSCCRSTPLQEASHDEDLAGTGGERCGDCHDVPIDVIASFEPTPRIGQEHRLPQASPAIVLDWPSVDPSFTCVSSAHIPPPLAGPLVYLRTTVLRC